MKAITQKAQLMLTNPRDAFVYNTAHEHGGQTDGRTPVDSKDRANAWRRAVKTAFAHAPLYLITA